MSKLELSLDLSAKPDKLLQLARDFDKYHLFMPSQLKNISVISKNTNEVITEETLVFSSIRQKIVQQTRHNMVDSKIDSQIITGPAKGTAIEVLFESNNERTKAIINIQFVLSLKFRIFSPLIKKLYKTFLMAVLYKMNTIAESE